MRPRNRRLNAEALEARQLMAIDVLEGAEPANSVPATAMVFTFPAADNTAVLKGQANKDDKDFFAFTAPANGTLQATLPTLRADLEVEDGSSREILELEPKDGRTTGSVQLVAGQRYTVRLRGTEKAATAYEATLVFTPGAATPPTTPAPVVGGVDDHGGHGGDDVGDDNNGGVITPPTTEDAAATVVAEVEPNNARLGATRFSLTGSTRLEGSASKDDRDFFAFTVPADGNFTIGLRTPPGAGKVQVEIEDQSGREVLELEPHDGISSGTVALVAGRTYQLRVKADAATPVAYEVDLQPAAATTPPTTPPATAPVTAVAAMRHKFDTNGDEATSPLDALLIINHMNARGFDDHPSASDLAEIVFDMNDDGAVTSLDALLLINYLNAGGDDAAGHDVGDDHSIDLIGQVETEVEHGPENEVEVETEHTTGYYAARVDSLFAELELQRESEKAEGAHG
jgi:hypothetical protein